MPTDTTVTLEIRAQDVAHSWWIPKLGGKFDAVPGYTNYTWFKIPSDTVEAGTEFRGQCAELCGRNHANMIARRSARSRPQEYEAVHRASASWRSARRQRGRGGAAPGPGGHRAAGP